MKRLLVIASMGVLLPALLLTKSVYAQYDPFGNACDGATTDAAVCQTNGNNDPISGENGVLMKAVDIISYMSGFAAVLMIIIGGLKFVTSNGDANSVNSARNTIIYALIGVVVLLLCQTIVKFVIRRV